MGGPERIWLKPEGEEYVRADLYDARTSEFAMARTDADQLRMTLRQVEAERDAILAQVEAMRVELVDIAESDDIENCLDPQRNKRVAISALAKPTGSPDGQQ